MEFVLSACLFLKERYSTVNPECRVQETEEVIDWAWVQDPFLVNSKGSLSACTALENWIYFGWHWDVVDANGILMVSKANDAGVDLSL